MGRGGDQMVSLLALNSDDLSSNRAWIHSFYSIQWFDKNPNKIKRGRWWHLTIILWQIQNFLLFGPTGFYSINPDPTFYFFVRSLTPEHACNVQITGFRDSLNHFRYVKKKNEPSNTHKTQKLATSIFTSKNENGMTLPFKWGLVYPYLPRWQHKLSLL